MAVVATNKKLSEVTYAANEAITVNPNVTLTIDASNTLHPKSITATSGGVIELVNSSDTQIICFTLYGANSATYKLDVSTGATLRARGKMLTVHTGTGAANQIIDFTVGELAKVPYPSCVLIEHSAGSGSNPNYTDNNGSQYVAYPIVCTAGKPKVFAPTDVSNGECGRVLFWDATTRKLSCGNGTRGNVIPAGCKVLIPNICVHGNGTIADSYSSRAQVLNNSGGIIDMECVAFSDAFSIYAAANNGSVNYKNAGMVGVVYHSATNAPITASYLTVNPCCNWVAVLHATALILSCYVAAKATLKDIAIITSRNVATLDPNASKVILLLGAQLIARGNGSTLTNAYFGIIGDRDVNHHVVYINGFQGDENQYNSIKNITFINGQLIFNGLAKNIMAIDFKHASSFKGVSPSFGTGAITCYSPASNIAINGIKRVGSPIRSANLITIDEGVKNISVFLDMLDYPLNDATAASIISSNGTTAEFEIANATTSTGAVNVFSSYFGVDQALRLKGVVANTARIYPSANAYYDGVSGLPENVITSYYGISNHCAMYLLALSNNPNSGWICFSTFGEGENVVLSDGAQADSGALWLRTLGAKMTAESPVFHGITAFLGSAIKYSYVENSITYTDSATAPLNISIKFAVARSTGAFTVDYPLTQANLAAALLSLYEYDRYDGCRIRLTAKAIVNDPTLTLNKVFWDVAHDQNYVRHDVSLFIRGIESGETIDVCLLSDDSVIQTFNVGAAQSFTGGANLNKQIYFNRRKNGILVYSTKYAPITLRRGNLGNIDLFAGSSVQLADAAKLAEISERSFERLDAVFNRSELIGEINTTINSINGNIYTLF